MQKILISLVLLSLSMINLNASSLVNTLSSNKMFMGVGLGYSYLNFEKKDQLGNVSLLEKQNKNGKNILFEIGYYYNKNLEFSFNYQIVDNDDVDINNLYISSKYKLLQKDYTPYIGVNLGYSQLSWNKNPIYTLNNDNKSGSYLIGTNIGILYSLSTNIGFDINYSLSYMGHKTYLKTTSSDTSELRHDFLQSINMGLRYNF